MNKEVFWSCCAAIVFMSCMNTAFIVMCRVLAVYLLSKGEPK